MDTQSVARLMQLIAICPLLKPSGVGLNGCSKKATSQRECTMM